MEVGMDPRGAFTSAELSCGDGTDGSEGNVIGGEM